jgi:putative transposase
LRVQRGQVELASLVGAGGPVARPTSALHPHPAFLALGVDAPQRSQAYRDLLYETLAPEEMAAIRVYLQQQRALGATAFQAMVQAKTQRFAGIRPAHRPRKATHSIEK